MGEGSKGLDAVLWEATAEKDGDRDSRVGIRIIWLYSEATVFLYAFSSFGILSLNKHSISLLPVGLTSV